MPLYQISAPDGNTYEIEGPEGAAQQDVERAVLAQFPEAGKPPQGFLGNLMDLAVESGRNVISSAKVAPSILAGSVGAEQAKEVTALATPGKTQPAALREAQEAFADENAAFQRAKGLETVGPVVEMFGELGKQILTNPKGAMYLAAQSSAQMVPQIMAMIGGGALGGALGPAGAYAGATAGAMAVGAPLEAASTFAQEVGAELQARKLPLTEANVAALLQDDAFKVKAVSIARKKGLTTAALDAAMTAGAGRIATGAVRNATKAATAELGEKATKEAIAKRAKEITDQRTLGQKAGRAGAAVTADTVGGGLSELGGGLAAKGEINLDDIGQEMLGGLGQSVVEVPAAARAVTKDMTAPPDTRAQEREELEAKLMRSYERDAEAAARAAEAPVAEPGVDEPIKRGKKAAAQAPVEAAPEEAFVQEEGGPAPAAPFVPTPVQERAEVAPTPQVPKEFQRRAAAVMESGDLRRTTRNWVGSKAGVDFLMSLGSVDPAQADARRNELAPKEGSMKRELYDALFPATPAQPSVSGPDQSTVRQPDEPGLAAPVEAAARVDTGGVEPSERPGVASVGPTAGEQPAPVGGEPAPLSFEDVSARIAELAPRQSELMTARGRKSAAAKAELDALNLELGQLRAQQRDLLAAEESTSAEPVVAEMQQAKPLPNDSQALIDDALRAYNAPARDESPFAMREQEKSALSAVQYLQSVARAEDEPAAMREYAQRMLDAEIDPKDIERANMSRPMSDQPAQGVRVPEIDAAVANGDLMGALDAVVTSPDTTPIEKVVAARLKRASSLPGVETTNDIEPSGQYDARSDTVQLKSVDSHTVLHETVHGMLHRLIAAHLGGLISNPHIKQLDDLFKYVRRVAPGLSSEYGFKDLSEFASEAMSNRQFQDKLRAIPYQRSNVFSTFAAKVRDLLGIKKGEMSNAQAEAMVLAEAAMDQGRALQEAYAGTEVVGSLGTKPALSKDAEDIIRTSEIGRAPQGWKAQVWAALVEKLTVLSELVSRKDGVDMSVKFRTLLADNAASVSDRMNRLFDNGVRTARGVLNPEGLLRQANDSAKLLLPWVRDGALVKDATTGQYRTEPTNGPTLEKVFGKVRDWAAANDMSFEQGYVTVSKLLEAKRLQALREANAKPGATQVDINKLSNTFKGADADAQIDILVAEYDADPALADISKDLDDMRNRLVDDMEAAGRITKTEADEWRTAVNYVPFARVAEFENVFRQKRRVGSGLAALGGLPTLSGSEALEVTNVLDNFVTLSGWMIQQTVRTDAMNTTLDLMRRMGMAKRHTTEPRIDKSKVVTTYQNGKEVWYSLPSRWDALAFQQMKEPKLWFVRKFSEFANILRVAITAQPPFAIKQVVDDIQRAYMYSGVKNPSKLVLPTLRNFFSIAGAELMGKDHPIVQRHARVGQVGEYDFNTRRPADSILQDLGLIARGPVAKLVHRLEGITRASDIAVRSAIYDQTLAETKSAAAPTGDALLAQTRAREFINFRRQGAAEWLPSITATVPFFNAYIQGMDVLYRNATGKGSTNALGRKEAARLFMAQGAKMAGFAAIYAMLASGGDDEETEYDELSLRTKLNNWILPGGVKVPVPRELAALFKVPAEIGLEYFRRVGTPEEMEATEATITVLKNVFETISPAAPIPAAIKPVLEAMMNYSVFTGNQLEGQYMQQLLPSERKRATSSELAIAVSKAAENMLIAANIDPGKGISPIKIDNFLNGYFGTMAANVTMLTDQLLNPDRLDRPLSRMWLTSVFSYNPDVLTRRKDEFYEVRERAAPYLATLDKLKEAGRLDEADAFIERNRTQLILAEATQTALGSLSDYRKHRNYINGSQSVRDGMSQEERKRQLAAIEKEERQVVGWLRSYKASLAKQYPDQ